MRISISTVRSLVRCRYFIWIDRLNIGNQKISFKTPFSGNSAAQTLVLASFVSIKLLQMTSTEWYCFFVGHNQNSPAIFCSPPNAVPIFSPVTLVHLSLHPLHLFTCHLQLVFGTMSKEYDHLFKLLIIGDSGKSFTMLCNVHTHRLTDNPTI